MVVTNTLNDLLDKDAIRGQLYTVPSVSQLPILFNQELSVETLSTIVTRRNIFNGTNDSFIVGHTTNGVVGDSQTGEGGTQIVVGDFRSDEEIVRVTNPGNNWKDFLRDTRHWDTDNSTASIDTGNHKIIF